MLLTSGWAHNFALIIATAAILGAVANYREELRRRNLLEIRRLLNEQEEQE